MPIRRTAPLVLDPHADACALSQLPALVSRLDGPLAVDLFCGAGGLSQGLHDAGFSVIAGVEHNRFSMESHRSRFPGATLQLDLSDQANRAELIGGLTACGKQIDLITGGPPCQPFSTAGKGKIRDLIDRGVWEEDARKSLWMAFVDIVKGVRPKAVLLENVPQMALGGDAKELRALRCELERAGYAVHVTFLKASDYGVPQPRERLFLVALEQDLTFNWPAPSDGPPATVSDAIRDLPPLIGGEQEVCPPYDESQVLSPLVEHLRRGVRKCDRKRINDHYTRAVRPDDLEIYRLMDQNTKYDQLPEHLRRYRQDIFRDKYNRLPWDEPSRTITAHLSKDGYWYIHPRDHRTLSVREAARIQTFPDDFRFAGRMTDAYRQIGEAVPPLLAKALGTAIRSALGGINAKRPTPQSEDIAHALAQWALHARDKGQMKQAWMLDEDPWRRFLHARLASENQRHLDAKALKVMGEWFGDPGSVLGKGETRLEMATRAVCKIHGEAATDLKSDLQIAGRVIHHPNEPGTLEHLSPRGRRAWQDHVLQEEVNSIKSPPKEVVRLAARVFGRPEIDSGKLVQLLVAGLLGDPGSGNSAQVLAGARELSRTTCKSTSTACTTCPLSSICRSAVCQPV